MSDDASTEPLLPHVAVVTDPASSPLKASPMDSPTRFKSRRIWPLLTLLLLVNLSTVMYTLPLNRVIELRLCQEHYGLDKPVLEKMCKIDEIQRKLAWLQGIMETTLVVCGTCGNREHDCIVANNSCDVLDFLVTIPFSFVAERWGIKVVLWCNLVPRVCMSAWAITVGKSPRMMSSHIRCDADDGRALSPTFTNQGHHCWSISRGLGRRVRFPIHNLYFDFSIDGRVCRAVSLFTYTLFQLIGKADCPQSILLLIHKLHILCRVLPRPHTRLVHNDSKPLASLLD
jgi:hypothetical protein